MKTFRLLLLSLLAMGTLSFTSSASAGWYTPRCTSGQLKVKPIIGKTDQYHCIKTVSRIPSCPSGYSKKTDAIGKDKCEKVSSQTKAAQCKLGVLDNKNNWRINRRNGADNCTHKTKNKGQKPLKCTGAGYSLSVDRQGNRDMCVKSGGVSRTTVSCRSNETHRKAGVDKCESVTETRPTF